MKVRPYRDFHSFSLLSRSYHPFISIHYLKISIGGWVPYTSFLGILRSSMKIAINFFPSSGPKTPFLLLVLTFPSMSLQVQLAVVCPENEVIQFVQPSSSLQIFMILLMMFTVFPVPVGPQIIKWNLWSMASLMKKLFLIESEVGIIKLVQSPPIGVENLVSL